jgi:hypothetical protein
VKRENDRKEREEEKNYRRTRRTRGEPKEREGREARNKENAKKNDFGFFLVHESSGTCGFEQNWDEIKKLYKEAASAGLKSA